MKPAGTALIAVLILTSRAEAAVEVRVAGESVDIQATNAPLAEVLASLSRQTQMKVVYEGAPPRQTISLDLKGRTPVEAVVAAMEGQGVNYAMAMDDTGTRVQTLLVTGTATSSPASRASGPEFPDRHVPRDLSASAPPEGMDEPEPVPEEDGAPPPDTSVGLNAANPNTLAKEAAEQPQIAPAPVDNGTGWSTSPFAPTAPTNPEKKEPTPQATPPPFNP